MSLSRSRMYYSRIYNILEYNYNRIGTEESSCGIDRVTNGIFE